MKPEIEEFKNDFKSWMEMIVTPLNIIIDFLIDNHIPKNDGFHLSNDALNTRER